MSDDIRKLKLKIEAARAYAKQVCEARARLAGVLSGAFGATGCEFEFPEPDTMHVYMCMFGRRMGEPTIYRLSFGRQLKWVGIFHPWGLKPADIVVAHDVIEAIEDYEQA